MVRNSSLSTVSIVLVRSTTVLPEKTVQRSSLRLACLKILKQHGTAIRFHESSQEVKNRHEISIVMFAHASRSSENDQISVLGGLFIGPLQTRIYVLHSNMAVT